MWEGGLLRGAKLWKGMDLRIWDELWQHRGLLIPLTHPDPSKTTSSSNLDLEKPQGTIKADQALSRKKQ